MTSVERSMDAPTQKAPEQSKFEPINSKNGNAEYEAAQDRTRLACNSAAVPGFNDLRPVTGEAQMTPNQRQEAVGQSQHVQATFNDFAVKYPSFEAPPEGTGEFKKDVQKLDKVLDNPDLKFAVKLENMPDPQAPKLRCLTPPASVTFPPPAMEGNYKVIDNQLHIINSQGRYTPFHAVIDRLQGRPIRVRT
jgi:hypothetical protein